MAGAGGRLTTHVLDTVHGRPAAGLKIELFRDDGRAPERLRAIVTNADGRADRPLLEGEAFRPGRYTLVFHAGAYFRGLLPELPDPPFLDQVPVAFGIALAGQHYHVPLLLSPYGYSTYRGS